MNKMNSKFLLPIVPKPPEGEATVLYSHTDFKEPFLKSDGYIDLCCGKCSNLLCESLYPDQIENLLLLCPKCQEYNAIVSISTLEQIVVRLQALPEPSNTVGFLRDYFNSVIEKDFRSENFVSEIRDIRPELGWIDDLIVPTNPGELFTLLTFLLTFFIWWQGRKQKSTESPSVIVNNFFDENIKYKGIKRNERCPCGSGKKFKYCHGSIS